MEANPDTPASGGGPPSSSAVGAVTFPLDQPPPPPPPPQPPSRYEAQKRRDWNTFLQYLRNHKPPLSPSRCGGPHVIEFLRYLDQFGKTRVHLAGCAFFGRPDPPAACACPLRQAWGSLDALIGRLRAAFEESGGRPEASPFAARAVRVYLREVRDTQARARGIPYEKKKKRKRPPPTAAAPSGGASASSSSIAVGDGSGGRPTSASAGGASGVRVAQAGAASTSAAGGCDPATGSVAAAKEGSCTPPGAASSAF